MRDNCESTCGDQQWDTGLDTYGSPCNSDLWSASFWLADQAHHDDHNDDHHEDLWTILVRSSIDNVSCAFKS